MARAVTVHAVEHGNGLPVLVLHGAGVDHRETEACFEPALAEVPGLRRIYPDLPGTGRTPAPETVRSADDVLGVLPAFADEVAAGGAPAYAGPTLVVAGRLDSTVGYAAAVDLLDEHPRCTLAVVDDAGHALPHEAPHVLRALLREWLERLERSR